MLRRRSDHGHTTANQIGHQRRQAIVLAFQPVVLDRHVLALDVAGFAKPLRNAAAYAAVRIGRPAVEEPDHRHRRLLRPRRQRPRRRRAAEEGDELAASHRCSYHSITSSVMASSDGGTSMPSALAVLQVDDELELGRLHDRQVGGLGALEDAAGIDADLTIRVRDVGSGRVGSRRGPGFE